MKNKIKLIGVFILVLIIIAVGVLFIYQAEITAHYIPDVKQIGGIDIKVKNDTSYFSSKLTVKNKTFLKIGIDTEQEKLNPLLEQLISLTRKLDEALNILPKSERFDQVIKGVNHHANLQVENHKKQMDFLRQSQQKISDENKQALAALATEQKAIKEAIETKLRGKLF